MILQTQIPLILQEPLIDYHSKILLLGSCFVENIGSKLDYFKFDILQNPFGIVFHPIAIEKLIDRAIKKEYFTEKDVFISDDRWNCFEVHSSLSETSKELYLELLNGKLTELVEYINSASHIILTFGTSWVYRFKQSGQVVSNCYKIPQKNFSKELLSVDKIEESYLKIIANIRELNQKAAIITTVSPVRHLKDGFIENTRSKANLIAAIHNVLKEKRSLNQPSHQAGNVEVYFPSYEIMMDELRDYRFYKKDMIHPNDTAISIIWEKFSKAWISSETDELQKEIAVIQSGLSHQPFHSSGAQHQQFLKDLEKKILSIQKRYPFIRF